MFKVFLKQVISVFSLKSLPMRVFLAILSVLLLVELLPVLFYASAVFFGGDLLVFSLLAPVLCAAPVFFLVLIMWSKDEK